VPECTQLGVTKYTCVGTDSITNAERKKHYNELQAEETNGIVLLIKGNETEL